MSEKLAELRTLLSVVKQLPQSKIDQEFYNLMIKAKNELGETSYNMASFYYEYANFILVRIQRNFDIFNAGAVPDNVQNQQDELGDIPEQFEDSEDHDGDDEEDGAEKPNGKPVDPVNEGQANLGEQHKIDPHAEEEKQGQGSPQQVPEENDKDVCMINLEQAIRLFEVQLERAENMKSETSVEEILDGLRRARCRLGDLCVLEEDFQRAIELYGAVIAQQQRREGGRSSRLIAELYFLIGNSLLYQNKKFCQNQAIKNYINAVHVLLNHLRQVLYYDTSSFQMPTPTKIHVDRFPILYRSTDSDTVKEIKEVITCLLDKIEDTSQQVGVNPAYEAEKAKEEGQKKKNEFKPVDENTKVINLGSFGNRKKKAEDVLTQPAPIPSSELKETKDKQQEIKITTEQPNKEPSAE